MDYDVIIAGGSFPGLAAAVQLRGRRVLLVEPHAIGAVQTSACGTLLGVLEATGTMDSLLQTHDRFILHLQNREIEFSLPYPFCTFDYRIFCSRLLDRCDAKILHTAVLGHRGHLVFTTHGWFDAEILIDATGWRAALTTNAQGKKMAHTGKSFGLETVISVQDEGLHFYYDSGKMQPYNIGWLFPTGASSRAGFASYKGQTHLNQAFVNFLRERFGHSPNGRHGGYFPHQRRSATSGIVFRAGDAAGQCIPFSGEGIRPALYFGSMVGQLARRALDGEMRVVDALWAYRRFVTRHKTVYRLLWLAQKGIPGLPMAWIEAIAEQVQPEARINAVMHAYWKAIDPTRLVWQI